MILVHGGSFSGGDKSTEARLARAVLGRGWAAATINYRLSGEARFPAAVSDVKAAIRWLRANAASFGLDGERIALWGESAGGYLAAMAGVTGSQTTRFDDPSLGNSSTSSAVAAVIDWYGPSDFALMDAQFAAAMPAACNGRVRRHDPAGSPEGEFLGAALPTIPDLVQEANPITYLATATSLPVFALASGEDDCVVPWQQSQLLHLALRAAGASSTFTLVPGAGHGDAAIVGPGVPAGLAFLASVFGE